MKVFRFFFVLVLLQLHFTLLWGQGNSEEHTAAENVQVLDAAFNMPQLNRTRRIWVYLPPDYATSEDKRYPVLYMQDGQNLFDKATSYQGQEWKVDESLNRLFEEGQEGVIVVGIDHGEEHRNDEYAPWVREEEGGKSGGEGGKYVQFLAETLKPYIDEHFRTKPEREYTGIAGSSLGGIISLYGALVYPQTFGLVGVISPAIWYNPEIIEFVEQQNKTHDTRFYFITSEKEGPTVVGGINLMYDALLAQGHEATHVKKGMTAEGEHNEIYYSEQFPAMYQWLYQPQQRPAEPVVPPVEPEPPTGLEELDATAAGIQLFPNPAQDQFQLVLPDQWSGRSQGYLMDMQGRILSPLRQLHNDMLISTEALPKGIFFLVVIANKQRVVLRFVKE